MLPAAAVESAAPSAPAAAPWPLAQRIGFRFLFAYFALYHFALVDNTDFDKPWLTLAPLWHALVPWVGHHVFRVRGDISFAPTGSGDKLYDWLLVATFAALAAVATVVWSILDRRRTRYDRLATLLRVFIRYHLAVQMFGYGFAKVIKTQFPDATPYVLSRAYGDSSPMGLLWSFMGFSTAYTFFAGAAEVLGGALVLFRRTTTLGAVVILGVMSNVAMLNYCYDVPVKLFSTHLVLMALVLLAPDARRLADVLVFHRATAAAPFAWTPARPAWRWTRRIVKAAFALFIIGWCARANVLGARQFGSAAPKPAGYGVYDVAGDARYHVAFLDRQFGGARTVAGLRLVFDLPPKDGVVTARILGQPMKSGTLAFATPDADHVTLKGTIGDEKVELALARSAGYKLLTSRGFHLVSEFPFNR